jgi:hypothetical protein
MKRALFLLSLLSAAASAAERAPDLARVLGGYERTASAADIRALGPQADRLLIAHAEAPGQTLVQRQRAIVSLRFVPTAYTRSYALALLRVSTAADGPQALDAASAITALSAFPDTLSAIVPQLAHLSADARQAAAAALGVMRASEALGSLGARLSVESDPGVRLVLRQVVKQLQQ